MFLLLLFLVLYKFLINQFNNLFSIFYLKTDVVFALNIKTLINAIYLNYVGFLFLIAAVSFSSRELIQQLHLNVSDFLIRHFWTQILCVIYIHLLQCLCTLYIYVQTFLNTNIMCNIYSFTPLCTLYIYVRKMF